MTTIRRAVRAMLATATALAAISPALANSIYLNIQGVTGPVTSKAFLGDILLHAYSQGFTDPTTAYGGAGGGAATKVSCGAISIVKSIDSTSPDFLKFVTLGSNINKATIYFAGSGATATSPGTVPYVITLTNVRVTSIQQGDTVGNTSGLGITENISMVAETFQFSYRTQNPDGTFGNTQTYGFDCATNRSF